VGVARSSTGEGGNPSSISGRTGINALREDTLPMTRCGPSGGKGTALRPLDGEETTNCDEALAIEALVAEEFRTNSAFSGEVGGSTVTSGRRVDLRDAGPVLIDITSSYVGRSFEVSEQGRVLALVALELRERLHS